MVSKRRALALRQSLYNQTESLQDYEPGGYHPVHIGDTIGHRFNIVHKLGFGRSSTVWLCWHKHDRKWVALKIIRADDSREDRPELKLLHEPGFDRREWDREGVVLPCEYFWIEGPNGRHLCEVLPVLGRSVKDEWSWGNFGLPVLKELLHQTVSAVDFMRLKGICHGDLRPSNILMRIEDITFMEKDELMELLGHPLLKDVFDEEPKVSYVVYPARLDCLRSKESVAIVNLGLSFRPPNPPMREGRGITCRYSAPEMLCYPTLRPSFPSDVWTLVCTLFEIRMGRGLFDSAHEEATWISMLEDRIGPLSKPYRAIVNKSLRRIQETNEDTFGHEALESSQGGDGTFGRIPEKSRRRQQRREEKAGHKDAFLADLDKRQGDHCPPKEDEMKIFGDLLWKALKWDPEERLSSNDVLQHEWLVDRESTAVPTSPTVEPVPDKRHQWQELLFRDLCKSIHPPSKKEVWLSLRSNMHRVFRSLRRISRNSIVDFVIGFLVVSLLAILFALLVIIHGTEARSLGIEPALVSAPAINNPVSLIARAYAPQRAAYSMTVGGSVA